MIVPELSMYMRFQLNTNPIKRNGVMQQRKIRRFDLSRYTGNWKGFEKLKTSKGEVYFTLHPCDKNPNRQHGTEVSEYYLQMHLPSAKTFNLSALRLLMNDEQDVWTCSGEPSQEAYLRSGERNPLYEQKDDGFVFRVDKSYNWVEVWVITGARYMIDAYRHAFALHKYDAELDKIRQSSKDYVGL